MADGGQIAAYGFRYQYLAAAEQILLYLVDNASDIDAISLTIEPARLDAAHSGDGDPDEVIDYTITDNGSAVQRTQVKASREPSASRPLRPGTVKDVFSRMGPGAPGEGPPQILTNRPPSKRLRERCGAPIWATPAQTTYEMRSAQERQGIIIHDQRSVAEVKQALLQQIRTIRGDQALGRGATSADFLMSVLLDHIFDAAAGMSPNTISAAQILQLLCTPDADLAHAMREYDWGAPLLEVPRLVSAVPRIATLAELTAVFNDSVAGRIPTVVILSGVTGFGKSTIAADFCHLNRHLYERIIWVDCREEALIEAKAKDTLAQMGVSVEPESDVAALFRTAMGRIGGPFVVVFDSAADRTHIERFVPTSGCGITIVTTPSNTTWWTSAHRILVEGFTTQEAIRCFARYASVDDDQHHGAIEAIVERLQKVPLAIAMAGLYFHDSGEDVAKLSTTYFDTLAALDVPSNIPEGFDRTAFAAVQLAVARLSEGKAGSDDDRRRAQEIIRRSSMLAPELIPFNLILQALSGVEHDDPTSPPRPAVADTHTRNVIMATLQTQTIARRRHYVDTTGAQNPASDTLNIHPLVHEILQTIHLKTEAEVLVGPLSDLMACVYGWLEQMRHEGDFFPVDQLLVHSDHLLAVVDALNVSDLADDDLNDYRRAQALLKYEAASAYSSRGQHERSVDMLERALDDIKGIDLSPPVRAQVAKAAANAVTDIHLGGLDIARAVPLAERLVDELRILEGTDHPHAGEWVHLSADLGARALRSLGSAQADDLIAVLDEIAGRQRRSPSLTRALQEIGADIKAGQLVSALNKIALTAMQPEAQSPQTKANLQQLTATALLHLGGFDDAADTIEQILAEDPYPHLAELYKRLYTMLDTGLVYEQKRWRAGAAGARLSQMHTEIRTRISRRPETNLQRLI